MNIPDNLPTLHGGAHPEGARQLCAMEAAAWLANEKHSDSPMCVFPLIAAVARRTNDSVDDATRQTMWPLILRCLDTRTDDPMVRRRLALWCAERVLPIYEKRYPGDDRVRKCTEVTRRYLDGQATGAELAKARSATAAYAAYADDDAAYAAYAAYASSASSAYASDAAYDAYTDDAAYDAYAADAAYAAYTADGACVRFLSELLDEFDRLTGRTTTPEPEAAAWNRVVEFAHA